MAIVLFAYCTLRLLPRLVAKTQDQGYTFSHSKDRPQPCQGYCFHILKGHGSNTEGGRVDYTFNGHLALGFALVAYPVEYRKSGVMTFIVNGEGVVYQKDLGHATKETASRITRFDPAPGWSKASPEIKP